MQGIMALVAGPWGSLGVLREGLEQPQKWGDSRNPRKWPLAI